MLPFLSARFARLAVFRSPIVVKSFVSSRFSSASLISVCRLCCFEGSCLRRSKRLNCFRQAHSNIPPPPKTTVEPPPKPKPKKQMKKITGTPITWPVAVGSLAAFSLLLGILLYFRRKKEAEIEKQRQRYIGKALIGGPWEMVGTDGKVYTDKDFLGKWYFIYFGFTHCPDICPDQIERMMKIVENVEKDKGCPPIHPLVFSVDPERDTPEAMKKYLSEFSPRILGLTGSKEQVRTATRAFRVYFSPGPRDEENDYIVDHTVVIYLMGPDGEFVDYYGQDKDAEFISNSVKMQMLKYDVKEKRRKIRDEEQRTNKIDDESKS